jgi:hypothetical protein
MFAEKLATAIGNFVLLTWGMLFSELLYGVVVLVLQLIPRTVLLSKISCEIQWQ